VYKAIYLLQKLLFWILKKQILSKCLHERNMLVYCLKSEWRINGIIVKILSRVMRKPTVGLRPAWIQTSLRIRAVWSGSMLFAISFPACYRVCKRTAWIRCWSDCADAQAGLDLCWSQTHCVGFVDITSILPVSFILFK
jgi:hypothetical protein